MKNKYKGLAEYLVKKDQYLALNIEQARHIVKLVRAFEKSSIKSLITYTGKKPKLKKLSKKQQSEYDKLVDSLGRGFDKAFKDMLK